MGHIFRVESDGDTLTFFVDGKQVTPFQFRLKLLMNGKLAAAFFSQLRARSDFPLVGNY